LRFVWVAGVACSALACNQEAKTQTTRERSEIVKATGSASEAPAMPAPVATPSPAVLPAHRLCEGQLARAGRDAPKKPLSRKAAQGARPVGASAFSPGRWTWVNLWAAWCAPCKEEMPRLLGFAARISQAGGELGLSFVSLDDDERQLEQFLAAQPDTGVRATFWLREGHERDEWLAAAGVGKDPSLPVQLLVDPKGKIRCAVSGAVAEQDYAEIAAIVAAR
jgi:thiol-disulfide isomerase/thioredoxin